MKSVRLPVFVTAAALSAALAFGAFARTGCAADGLWQTDFKAAQAKAKEEKKYLLVDFTGSDWCVWCTRLHNEVFDKEPFKAEAPKQFVLVELDFPHEKEQSDDLKKQNKELSEKYNIEGFPTVLLMDTEGQVIARTGYRAGGVEGYLKHLAEMPRIYENVLALKAKLDKAQGLDRAKLLDEIVEGYRKLGNELKEITDWSKEIIALDRDNKAGLRVKYEFPMTLREAIQLLRTGKSAEGKEVLEKALALKGVSGEMLQEGYMIKGQIALSEKKYTEALAALKLAKEAAPDSRNVNYIASLIEVAEAHEAADKLEAGLDKLTGLDRAKLLDKLIHAEQKLIQTEQKLSPQFDPGARQKITKWTKEIIALDADDQAGLKKKYQFKAVMADAAELAQAGKTDEANAALDKALETADISGEDVQAVQFLKAQIALRQQHNAEAMACLKKALEAAPTGQYASVIKMLLGQIEQQKKPAAKKPADD
ncbi:MAG: thioredoxin fold domain-containing protein [Thermoguttaceae bacterium]